MSRRISPIPDTLSPADWASEATHVLLNPRMPEPQRTQLLAAQAAMPHLPGHVWLTTSGSSGIKWVALSKAALLTSAQAVNSHLETGASDVWALALPTFHVGGLGIGARAWLSGARVCAYANAEGEPRWDAALFHAFLADTQTTLTALVPTQLHDLTQAGCPSPPALRAVVVGGGALDAAPYQKARALGWPVLPSYGLSECCSQVATAPLSSLETGADGADPPLALLPHVQARIGEGGRIELQSVSLLTGYGLLGDTSVNPGADAQFADPKHGGWFLTEDRGILSGRVVSVGGRIGDFVKIGGESVDVASLARLWTRVQLAFPNLPETVLLAVPEARLGAAIHLFAAGRAEQGDTLAQAVAQFNREALPFERIQALHWLDAIPRSPLGKPLRRRLLEHAGLRTD